MYQRRAAALCAFSAFAVIPATLIALPAQAAAVRCHGERATIVGSTTDEVLQGTAGRGVIAGLAGDDARAKTTQPRRRGRGADARPAREKRKPPQGGGVWGEGRPLR